MAKIRAVVTEGDRQSGYKRVQVLFGTNYFLDIVENDGRVEFLLGAHHTGFKADATEVQGELHKYINEALFKGIRGGRQARLYGRRPVIDPKPAFQHHAVHGG
jgi:hypothetical protein